MQQHVIHMTNATPLTGWAGLINALPTVDTLTDGSRSYWSVPDAALDLRSDVDLGIDLARKTLRILREQQVSNGILSKILEQAPNDCCVAKGFRLAIEQEVLSR